MSNALALNAQNAVIEKPPGFGQRLVALPAKSQISLGIGIASLAAVVLALTMWGSQGDYKVLFSNLSDKDGGAVIAALSQMAVPYKLEGSSILVPAGKASDVRMKLATSGLPKGGVAGYELMDNAKFGQTQFQERLTFQRGLEGELTKSIQALDAVESARIHLALPNQNGFFREQQKPSASVVLSLRGGRTLDRSQIAGIVHLVASSVPEMNAKEVSVLDQTGALLSAPPENNAGAGLDAQQLQYVNQIESGYTKRIMELLEPVVGRENLRASVTADVDFAQTEATSEEFRPNQGANATQAIRSQQVSESGGAGGAGGGALATGIPGATTNQPPAAATAPVTGASAPLQTAQGGGGAAGSSSGAGGNRNATTNYEVDKTVRVTRASTGNVRRLNAAVVVNNNRSVTDKNGKSKPEPFTDAELEKLTSLVRETIGFSKDRGDSVRVVNAPFRVDTSPKVDTPLWKQPEVLDFLRMAAVPGGLALVAAIVFFGMIRPTLKAALAPPPAPEPGQQLSAVVDDDIIEEVPPAPKALPAPKSAEQLVEAKALAKQNPAAVASIVSGWVSGSAA